MLRVKNFEIGLSDNRVRRNRTKTNNMASPMPSHTSADTANRLAKIIPAMKEMEIHTNGMVGIVH